MAISTIGANGLGSGAVTNAKIDTVAATKLTGQVPDANAPSGSVIQVVQGSVGNDATTTSTSYVTSGLTATITPLSATSKILVVVDTNYFFVNANTAGYCFMTVYRDSTNLGGGTVSALQICGYMGATSNYSSPANMSVLDSPATTSATTYTLYFKSSSPNVGINDARVSNKITLMEIAA